MLLLSSEGTGQRIFGQEAGAHFCDGKKRMARRGGLAAGARQSDEIFSAFRWKSKWFRWWRPAKLAGSGGGAEGFLRLRPSEPRAHHRRASLLRFDALGARTARSAYGGRTQRRLGVYHSRLHSG